MYSRLFASGGRGVCVGCVCRGGGGGGRKKAFLQACTHANMETVSSFLQCQSNTGLTVDVGVGVATDVLFVLCFVFGGAGMEWKVSTAPTFDGHIQCP